LREELGTELDSFENEVHQRAVAAARAELGKDVFTRSGLKGRP
jgi:hypothetical protein